MYQFIVNPAAGTGRGYRIWKKLERQLENDSEEYQVYFTEYQGDAAEFARCLTADRDTAKIVVVVGGEGTYNEVLNGLSFKGLSKLCLQRIPFVLEYEEADPPGASSEILPDAGLRCDNQRWE